MRSGRRRGWAVAGALLVAVGAIAGLDAGGQIPRLAVINEVTPQNVRALPLLGARSIEYQGAFRVPVYSEPYTFNYQGTFAFNPRRNSLYGVGHDWYQLVAEIGIPELGTGPVDSLPRGIPLQGFEDPTDGRLNSINPGDGNAKKIGGLLPWGDRLIISAYAYYDAAGSQVRSHFTSSHTLATRNDAQGPFRLNQAAGYVSGYMSPVPLEWRTVLGGPAFTGQCCIPILSRTSNGPALFTFDPNQLGTSDPVPATPLLVYPLSNPIVVPVEGQANPYFHGATTVAGVAMPRGTRSVLFFGRHGIGPFCYGSGASCRDPEQDSQGTHAYPYVYRVWAYDAADLIDVRLGLKQPWEPRPYTYWDIDLPYTARAKSLTAVTYDPETNRLFLVAGYIDGSGPLFLVYRFIGV